MNQTIFDFESINNKIMKEENTNIAKKAIQKMVVLDFGKNSATIYDGNADKEVATLTHEQVLGLPFEVEPGTMIVAEDSHLGVPRTEKSLSQPYTKEELDKFYSDCKMNGVNIGLFPQKSTPRAAEYCKLEKSDENDPISIYMLLQDFPEICLRNPENRNEETHEILKQEAYDRKNRMNRLLNFARRFDYMHEEDRVSQWIKDNLETIAEQLPPEAQSAFGLDDSCRYKTTAKVGQLNINNVRMPQIYSVLSSLMGDIVEKHDGYYISSELCVRPNTGQLPGWKFVKNEVLNMKPFHFKGGVARSNLYYHGARNWIIAQAKQDEITLKKKTRGQFSKEEDDSFRAYRSSYTRSIKKLFMVFKKMLAAQM